MYPWLVAVTYFLAGIACIYYSVTRGRKRGRALFGWLAIPSFTIVALYLYFIYYHIAADQRSSPAQLAFIFFGLLFAIVVFIVAYTGSRDERSR
jgi:uncharacterized membrane protein